MSFLLYSQSLLPSCSQLCTSFPEVLLFLCVQTIAREKFDSLGVDEQAYHPLSCSWPFVICSVDTPGETLWLTALKGQCLYLHSLKWKITALHTVEPFAPMFQTLSSFLSVPFLSSLCSINPSKMRILGWLFIKAKQKQVTLSCIRSSYSWSLNWFFQLLRLKIFMTGKQYLMSY